MILTPLRRVRRHTLRTTLVMFLGVAAAHATDSYNTANHQLSSPSVTICNASYSNMVVTIGRINSGPSGTSASGSGDTFSPAYNQLTVPAVSVGGKNYFNVVASVSGLVSIGSVRGADTYDGKNLNIATVQVGATVYSGTVIQVGSIVRVGGGMPNGIRDLYNVESGQLFVPAVQDQVNGHVYTNVTVTVASIVSIGSGGTAPACGAGGSSSMLTAAQENAAGAAVEEYYATLSHPSVATNLATVAGYMVASGLFIAAEVEPSGISATLPDGTAFDVLADSPENLGLVAPDVATNAMTAGKRIAASADQDASGSPSSGGISPWPMSAPNPHEIAFLVNMLDTEGAFAPAVTAQLAGAWQLQGFAPPAFGVDFLDITLDNIVALGTGHPIDFLDIATHGYTGRAGILASTTPVTDANNAKYAFDISQKTVDPGMVLTINNVRYVTYTFTPKFLTNHLTFNPGAIVDNESCNGQNPSIAAAVQGVFRAAGVGLYLGWDDRVYGNDADQTDAFLFDRLLGEQSPSLNGLESLVTQRVPAQRPFPLSDILAAMSAEARSPPSRKRPYNYLKSANGTNFVATVLSSTDPSLNPIEYSLPSIGSMYVQEGASGGTLFIDGIFPAAPGTGQIVDASGTHPLTPSSWSTTQLQFELPSSGIGASGVVTVLSVDGIPSNPESLTEWRGQLKVTVTTVLSNMNGVNGTGGGKITATNNLDFRADVHPVVTAIDTTPVPQNFVFSGAMGDSTMSMTSDTMSFKSSDGTKSAQWALAEPVTILSPGYQPPGLSAGKFVLAPNTAANEPASCNSGIPGPQSSAQTAIFCPYGGAYAAGALTCSDNGDGLCKAASQDFAGYYGYPPWVVGTNGANYDGLLVFTLNPETYTVAFTSMPATLTVGNYFSQNVSETIDLSATIQSPLYAPTVTTPSVTTAPAAARTPPKSAIPEEFPTALNR